MRDPVSLRDQQLAFAAHVRAGHEAAFADIEPRRMAVYQRLVRGNIESLLEANFPVIHRTLTADRWNDLIEGFLREHHSETPLFSAIGEEFIHYLESRGDRVAPPWLAELAHWEWLELASQLAPYPATHVANDLLEEVPLLDPGVRIAAYSWPVQRIGPGFQSDVAPAQPTLLMVRRDADGAARFSELSPLLFQLIAWLQDDPHTCGRDLLQRLSDATMPGDRAAFLREAAAMLQRLHDEGVIAASQPLAATG